MLYANGSLISNQFINCLEMFSNSRFVNMLFSNISDKYNVLSHVWSFLRLSKTIDFTSSVFCLVFFDIYNIAEITLDLFLSVFIILIDSI